MTESATKGTPRETVFDVDVEQLARVYAQAGLDAAGDRQDELIGELEAIVDEVLNVFPDLEEVLRSALVSMNEKLALLDRVFGARISQTALNFLKVMAHHDRLGILRQVVRSASSLWKERNNRIPVELQLACELDHDLQRELVKSLSSTLGIDAIVTTTINPELIAGFVARVGDKVYDASARTSLERARQAMVTRAVEAIQNRPDQFMQQT